METRRILSIDGGGIRGVFSAAIIEQMEIARGTENAPKPSWEIFDCFVGTSAGSIIAAGLAAGIPAGTLKQIFMQVGAEMSRRMTGEAADEPTEEQIALATKICADLFPDKTSLTELSAPEQASLALACILKPLFEDDDGNDKLPRDLKRRLAVVTRNMEIGKVVFFGNFPEDQVEGASFWDDPKDAEGNELDEQDSPVWKIVLRSAALPPFFAPAGAYLDGGVSPFANPCFAAYVGVQRRLGWNPHEEALRFYSVGTGYHNAPTDVSRPPPVDDETPENAQANAALAEATHNAFLMTAMVDAMMQDINFLQHQVMKRQRDEGTIWYKRYNVSFDKTGFDKFGLNVADYGTTFENLAGTASPDVMNLGAIGTAVGKASLGEDDFADGPSLHDRRVKDEGREPKDRRLLKDVTARSKDPANDPPPHEHAASAGS